MPSRQTDSIVYRMHSLTTRTNHSRHFARSAGFAGVKGMLYESPEGEGADPHAIRPHRTFNSNNFVYPAPRSRAYMSIRHLQGAASDRPQQRRRRTSADVGHITRQQAHTAAAHPSQELQRSPEIRKSCSRNMGACTITISDTARRMRPASHGTPHRRTPPELTRLRDCRDPQRFGKAAPAT